MAYLQFAEIGAGGPSPVELSRSPAAAADTGFSPLEWSVVALAQRDRLSSLRQPGPVSIAFGAIFGGRHNPKLADPRLEALRQLAVHAWHRGYAVPKRAIAEFHAAGFSARHYEVLLDSISRGRAALQR